MGSTDNLNDNNKKEEIRRSGQPQIQEPGREPIARQRFEEILRNSESFLNSIINKSSYPMWIADDQGTLVWLNQACRDLLLLTDAEVVGKYNILQDNIVEEQGLLPLVRQVFEEGETVRFEIKYDSSPLNKLQFQHTAFVVLDVTMFPIMDAKGKITHAVIQHIDITERKRAEEALRESEKRFRRERFLLRALIDSIPDLIFFKDQDSVYLGCNKAFEAYAGMGESDLTGRTDLEIASPEVAEFFRRKDWEMLASGEAQLNEEWIPFKDGGGGFFETLKTPYYGPDGELLGLIGVSRDITSRKETEEALRESEERYRSLFQNHHTVMLLVDPETGSIMDANPAACAFYGFSKEELLTQKTTDLNTLSAEQVFQAMQSAKTEKRKRFEFQHRLANGEIRDVEIFTGPIRVKGQELLYSIIHDVTARKRAKEALRESEKKYRSLYQEFQGILNAIPDLLCLLSPDLKIVWSNEATVGAAQQRSAADLMGKSCYAIRHQSSEPCENCPVLRCFRSGQIETDERTGEGHTWELRAVPIYDDHGELVGAIELARNITERKRMEEALEKRLVALSRPLDDAADINFDDLFNLKDMQRLQDLFANSPGVASLITTPDGTPITRPSNFCRLCRIIRQAEQGRKNCAISDASIGRYNPDGPTIENCLSAGLCNAGASITIGGKHVANWLIGQVRDETQTEENMRKYARDLGVDEEEFIAAFREVPYMSADQFQQVAHALFVFANQLSAMAYQNVQQARFITERKQAEAALRDSERRLAEIIDFLPDATFAIDLTGKIIAWNRAIEEMTGVKAENMIGKGNYEYALPFYGMRRPILIDLVFMPDDEIEKKYAFVKREGDILLAEADVPLKGKIHLLWGKARPLYNGEGNIVGAIEAIRDISERQRAEEERAKLEAQIREVQKLESLGVLAGGIAHDFNNLLMAILGNADLALFSLSPASPARPNVEDILRASQRAADLCRQMLAYSGKGRFVVGRYDLSEIVQEMAQMLEVSVSKKATLRYSFHSDLPPVEADATQLRQVIMNLITNASEALGDRSGAISVSTGVMDCDRAYLSESYLDDNLPEGRYVYLEVADTGGGMDKETRRRIFDPFFTTKFTGGGLGLAAVLGIVRGHQGGIKVYSEPGQGTTFKVLLPAREWAPEDRAPSAAQSDQPLTGGTILLIDDDPDVRQVGSQMLKRLGFKVLTAAHGQEGLEIFRANMGEINCVLLDLTMPEMGGDEVFREIRRLRRDVCVILSSGYNEQDVTQRFVGKGLAGFIQKPYTRANLRETLNRVLGSK